MWKANWQETQARFKAWWNHNDLIAGKWTAMPGQAVPRVAMEPPRQPADPSEIYLNVDLRMAHSLYFLSRAEFPMEVLPLAGMDMGPGSLALFLGCEPGFSPSTVWFEPCWMQVTDPESLPPITFNPQNRWWKLTEQTLKASVEQGRGRYITGCPDLVENIDILASLREPQLLMMDMAERPEWVQQKVHEITRAWFEAYQRIYDIIRLEDGSSAFSAFSLWGPGKTAKVQCDASAMFSPEMFRQFVVPDLTAQCEWLDHSLYHLDGTQAMGHLDALLEIEALDAIEWTPQAGIERGGHPRWYPLYRKILEAGKSVQIVGVEVGDIVPLLHAIGSKGVYMMPNMGTKAEAEEVARIIKPFRPAYP
jgi:hypothetical protein